MNNLIILEKKDTNFVIRVSLLLLCLFIFITVLVYNFYKGNKIILPDLNDEFHEKSKFHLLKSMGWAFLVTLLFAFFSLGSNKKPVKYAVNKPVKI